MTIYVFLKLDFIFICFLDELLYGNGFENANEKAMKKLFVRCTSNDLLKNRISRETNLRVNKIIEDDVTTLLLFDESFSFNQYKVFLNTTGLSKDPSYSVPKSNTSTTDFALFVKDIAGAAAKGKLISRFKSVTRLVYFGTQTTNALADTVWHSYMHLVVSYLPNLESLVVNRLGHFKIDSAYQLHNKLAVYKRLKAIYLVQPHPSVIDAIGNCKGFCLCKAFDIQRVDNQKQEIIGNGSTVVYTYRIHN